MLTNFVISERSASSLNRMHKTGPLKKDRSRRRPLDGNPFMKGVVLKTLIKKPKKPNSANRKCVLVRLSNGKEMTAYVPGIGHNLQVSFKIKIDNSLQNISFLLYKNWKVTQKLEISTCILNLVLTFLSLGCQHLSYLARYSCCELIDTSWIVYTFWNHRTIIVVVFLYCFFLPRVYGERHDLPAGTLESIFIRWVIPLTWVLCLIYSLCDLWVMWPKFFFLLLFMYLHFVSPQVSHP